MWIKAALLTVQGPHAPRGGDTGGTDCLYKSLQGSDISEQQSLALMAGPYRTRQLLSRVGVSLQVVAGDGWENAGEPLTAREA